MNTTRVIQIVSLFMLIGTIAATAEAQRGGFGPPRIVVPQPYRPPMPVVPQPYRPPTPMGPQPGSPGFGIPNFRPPLGPQVPVLVKRCTHCGHEVPATSCDGQTCPYCGVVWGPGPGNGVSSIQTQEINGDMADTSGRRVWMRVIAGIAAIGLAGAGALIWYHCRPAAKMLN